MKANKIINFVITLSLCIISSNVIAKSGEKIKQFQFTDWIITNKYLFISDKGTINIYNIRNLKNINIPLKYMDSAEIFYDGKSIYASQAKENKIFRFSDNRWNFLYSLPAEKNENVRDISIFNSNNNLITIKISDINQKHHVQAASTNKFTGKINRLINYKDFPSDYYYKGYNSGDYIMMYAVYINNSPQIFLNKKYLRIENNISKSKQDFNKFDEFGKNNNFLNSYCTPIDTIENVYGTGIEYDCKDKIMLQQGNELIFRRKVSK